MAIYTLTAAQLRGGGILNFFEIPPGSVPTVDPDAQAFITAAAITDPTQQSAVNQLVVDLKGYGVWTKMKALYPFVGGTASQHKFNLKNPLDTDAAFRLVFNGGWTHSANGVKPNGTNGFADTFVVPNVNLINNNTHLSYYCRENISGAFIDFGTQDGGSLSVYNYVGTYYSDQYNTTSGRALSSNADTRGFIIGSRTASNIHKLFRNGSQIGTTNTGSSSGLNTIVRSIFFGAARWNSTSTLFFSSRQYSFASIGDGLTDTESSNFYTAVQNFQTTLGRSIGTQTVSDADAQAFITNAGIVDQVEANAINNLVIGMKADGVWSKMKAIYPFVGGSSTSHSFNLRNTSQFQITWNGGITHSSNGVLPNGVNGFGNTGLNLSTQTTLNDIHLGFYSRTHSTQNAADIGAATDNITNYHLMQLTGSTTFYIINESAFTTYPNFSDTDTKGFYVGTRSGTVVKGWKNGTLRATKSPATTAARPNFNVYLGGYNQGGTPALFSNRQLAFSSIGDGLTDTEATNLNTRVTQFQTALNRNV